MIIIRADSPDFTKYWKILWEEDVFQHPYYLPWTQAWFKEFNPSGKQVKDLSFIIVEDDSPLVGLLMTLQKNLNNEYTLSCGSKPILFLKSTSLSTSMRGINKALKKELDKILHNHIIHTIIYWDHLENNSLSFFGKYLMSMGASCTPYFTQIIDLSLAEDQLHQNLRKSFKSLINWGKKNLDIYLIDSNSITMKDIERFRMLHFDAAGRQTRSKKSWEMQYDIVQKKEAFILFGEIDHQLVTGIFMFMSGRFCYYGISASIRALFDKPMAHALIWESIIHAKKDGCLFYELGEQVYPMQANRVSYQIYDDLLTIPVPQKKELDISMFKQGFGGMTKARLDIRWQNK